MIKMTTRYQWLTSYDNSIYNRLMNIYTRGRESHHKISAMNAYEGCVLASQYIHQKTLAKITRSLCWTNKKDKMELAWAHIEKK